MEISGGGGRYLNNETITLGRDENQARGIGRYAIDFVSGGSAGLAAGVEARTELFFADSMACGLSALACGTNAPDVLRREAMRYVCSPPENGVPCFGSTVAVAPEKAVLANCSASREWDANGTNFGYNPARGATCGEFGHNDFYPVAVAAAQLAGCDGRQTLRAMICLDEIRGRLAEVFALKDHKIDHVVHGAIASAAVYGAMLGATAEQIESAIGLVVSHYVPFRAIRAGRQLSDSKGASAALSAEMAVLSMRRAMDGLVGPADIFRNPEALFCLFEPPDAQDTSPFDLTLSTAGDDFAVMGMHFKLGLYEHQSAGAIQALFDLTAARPEVLDAADSLRRVTITIYEPAYGIICDPAKRDPQTRQTADHSMVYIIATLLRKAYASRRTGWEELILLPDDYSEASLHDPLTRQIMDKIELRHGGPDYDEKYPEGIPTTLSIDHATLGVLSSSLVMHPEGHARNTGGHLDQLLENKIQTLLALATDDVSEMQNRLGGLARKSADEVANLYDFEIRAPG